MSAQRTVGPSGAQSQSFTVELSSPPTYWIGLLTDGRRGSRRGKTDATDTGTHSSGKTADNHPMVRRPGGSGRFAETGRRGCRYPYSHGAEGAIQPRGLQAHMDRSLASPRARRMLVVVPLALAFAVMELSVVPPAGTPTEMWAPVATTFVWLIAVWDGQGRPPLRLVPHLLAQLVMFETVARLFGWGLADAWWMGVTATAAGLLMTVLFARVKESSSWQIHEQRDNVRLLVVAFVCGALVALVGGYPNLDVGQFDRLTLWWVIRDLVYTYVAGATFLLLFYA